MRTTRRASRLACRRQSKLRPVFAVLVDIANEEREHVGEFLTLLKALAPDEAELYQKGQQEVEEIFKEIKD